MTTTAATMPAVPSAVQSVRTTNPRRSAGTPVDRANGAAQAATTRPATPSAHGPTTEIAAWAWETGLLRPE